MNVFHVSGWPKARELAQDGQRSFCCLVYPTLFCWGSHCSDLVLITHDASCCTACMKSLLLQSLDVAAVGANVSCTEHRYRKVLSFWLRWIRLEGFFKFYYWHSYPTIPCLTLYIWTVSKLDIDRNWNSDLFTYCTLTRPWWDFLCWKYKNMRQAVGSTVRSLLWGANPYPNIYLCSSFYYFYYYFSWLKYTAHNLKLHLSLLCHIFCSNVILLPCSIFCYYHGSTLCAFFGYLIWWLFDLQWM